MHRKEAMKKEKKGLVKNRKLQGAIWCCLSALDDNSGSYETMKDAGMTKLEWVQDAVVHIYEYLLEENGITDERAKYLSGLWEKHIDEKVRVGKL
jgi:hypothetical protein